MKTKYILGLYVGLVSFSMLFFFSFFGYSFFVKRYQKETYGSAYNEKRKELGIIPIPNGWTIKERSDNYIGWAGSEKLVGHKRKAVTFSGCNIEGELDVFRLSEEHGEERLLEVQYKYAHEGKKPTITYTYQIGNYAKVVSKLTADSLLIADKIRIGD